MSNDNIFKGSSAVKSMANALISIRIPKELLKETRFLAQQEGFQGSQELIRQALREYVRKRKLEVAMQELKKIQVVAHHNRQVRKATKQELNHLARKLYP